MKINNLKVLKVFNQIVIDLLKRDLPLELLFQTGGSAQLSLQDASLMLSTPDNSFAMLVSSAMQFDGKDFVAAPGISLVPINRTPWHRPSVNPNTKSIPMKESEIVEMSYLTAWWFLKATRRLDQLNLARAYPDLPPVPKMNMDDICKDLESHIDWPPEQVRTAIEA
jgi:hypothetical protein